MERDSFDESIDDTLLKNGFKYYDDWDYGPQSGWSSEYEHYTFRLTKHGFGYWLSVSAHASGTNPKVNLGSSNSAEEIISIRDSLSKLF